MKKITSTTNEYIKNICKLNNSNSLFLLEGKNLIKEALEKNMVKDLLILNIVLEKYKKFNVNIILVNKKIISKISNLKNPQEVIAICYKKNIHISKSNKILLLDDIQDPGNLGSLIRSAASFGFDKIITSFNCVSFYNLKTLRATQGSLFYVEHYSKDIEKEIINFKNKKYEIISTFLDEKNDINQLMKIKNKKIVLLLGNEGNGINSKYKKYFTKNIIIKTNKIESLNVAIAGSILMYLFS